MPDDPAASHWRWTHTAFVVALTALFVVAALLARWGLFTSWVITMLSLTLFTLVVGNGVTGVWKGAFVDERNRMSVQRQLVRRLERLGYKVALEPMPV